MTSPNTDASEPILIGKYQIVSLAGEGAMGAVYKARDTVLNRTVAVKVMNAAIARDEGLRERFLREAQSAGSLAHPNVVTIYDFGETDGHLFIAMEFVEGSDLEKVLELGDQMPLQAKLDIIVDTLHGLEYAHQQGIVHRDLKPANIRVTKERRAKLMDFGVAHLASQKMTQTGMMIGTPFYMAPEYISGKPVTQASDIFSMGAVLYEVLTGKKPFSGDTMHALLFAVVQQEPPAPSTIVPSLPPALDAVVRRAMAKEPAERYATAVEMAYALMQVRAALSGSTPMHAAALSTTLAHRVEKMRATVAPAASAATTASAPPDSTVPTAAPRPSATSERKRSPALMGVVVAVLVVGGGAAALLSGRSDEAAPPTSDAPVAAAAQLVPETTAVDGASPPVATQGAVTPAPTSAAAAPTIRPKRASTLSAPPAAPAISSPTASITPSPATSGLAPAPTQAAVQTAAPAAAPSVARSAAAELRDLIAQYAQAISNRDVAAVRAAYPTISRSQQQGFEQFFGSTKALAATLMLETPEIQDRTAEGRVSGNYEFTSNAGRVERQSVNFRAKFERTADGWRIISVR